jgi:NAD(P)H-dependent FMN reductase
MIYTVISGSQRQKSQSAKVARFCEFLLKKNDASSDVEVHELAASPLPFWEDSMWDPNFAENPKWKTTWIPLRDRLRRSDALVVVSPEWAGMVPGGLKNLFLFCGNPEMGHKPGLIVTVSASGGGAYPVAELRASSYKNNHLCYIPDHVIVRNVKTVMNDTASSAGPDDDRIRIRLDYSLKVLGEYARALKAVRESPVINFKDFANGM